MPNVTLSVPDDVLRRARIRAAEAGTSVSAMVREYLVSLGGVDNEFRRKEQLQADVLAHIRTFRASDRLSRDEVHNHAIH